MGGENLLHGQWSMVGDFYSIGGKVLIQLDGAVS